MKKSKLQDLLDKSINVSVLKNHQTFTALGVSSNQLISPNSLISPVEKVDDRFGVGFEDFSLMLKGDEAEIMKVSETLS